MITRSLIVAGVMLAAYPFVLPHLPPGIFRVPGQQRANYQRAQHYIQEAPADIAVVVGSSMSNELSETILGPGYYKLAFPGGSLATGLELIQRAGRRPKVLLIEINELLREPDGELLDNALSGWRRALRDRSPVFAEEGRPSDFAIGYLSIRLRRTVQAVQRAFHAAPDGIVPAPDRQLDPLVLASIMAMNRRALDRSPVPLELMSRVRHVGKIVDGLSQAGCVCIFYEMPIDSSLAVLAEPTAVRRIMHARFPAPHYRWVNFAHSREYHTVDGIHLTRTDADAVTGELVSSLSVLAQTH